MDDLARAGRGLTSTIMTNDCNAGIVRLPNGMVHISVVIPFPGVTAAMLEWWMACFCEDSVRYKLWCVSSVLRSISPGRMPIKRPYTIHKCIHGVHA